MREEYHDEKRHMSIVVDENGPCAASDLGLDVATIQGERTNRERPEEAKRSE